MTYKYHVDINCDYGSIETLKTYKFTNFDEAYKGFMANVEHMKSSAPIYWNVTLYDLELAEIKCTVSKDDFE